MNRAVSTKHPRYYKHYLWKNMVGGFVTSNSFCSILKYKFFYGHWVDVRFAKVEATTAKRLKCHLRLYLKHSLKRYWDIMFTWTNCVLWGHHIFVLWPESQNLINSIPESESYSFIGSSQGYCVHENGTGKATHRSHVSGSGCWRHKIHTCLFCWDYSCFFHWFKQWWNKWVFENIVNVVQYSNKTTGSSSNP